MRIEGSVPLRGRTSTLAVAVSAAALVLCLGLSCGGKGESPSPESPDFSQTAAQSPAPQSTADAQAIFDERASAAGLGFIHFNGMSGEYFMAEVTGSGGALLDYDSDGDLDVYLIQGRMLGPGKTVADAVFPPRHPLPLTDRLYRNDLEPGPDGAPLLRFTDVTEESTIEAIGYGMGVAVGDYDNDGWSDLYVTNLGPNQMLHNNGDGTFSDTTEQTGTGDNLWSVPAVFFDYDRDGWLDLYVGNYIEADPVNRPLCRDFTGAPDYCGPGAFAPLSDRLFHNRGDGTFEDVTHRAGLRTGFGGALGVVAADFNTDGWLDLYVTNDGLPNNLWINGGDGTFEDDSLLAGCSVNAQGKAEASMGVDAADFDGDGDLDLFMTHLTGETNTFYRNDGQGLFDDVTVATGLAAPSRTFTSFGTSSFDYDNDGWLDLFVVNGAVKRIEALARQGDPFPVHQPNQLFRNLGAARFEDVTPAAGAALELSEVSRGALFGDLDNDGDTDVVVVNNSGPSRLLINQLGQSNAWLGLRLVGGDPVRDMLGALVALERPGKPDLWRRVRTDGSFCSANDPRVLFGLADDPAVARVRVYWPDGSAEEWTDLTPGQYRELRQSSGVATAPLRSGIE